MQFYDNTNSLFFTYSGNWIISDLRKVGRCLTVNYPEARRKETTLVRVANIEQYNQFIIEKGISVASFNEETQEEIPREPFKADPTQVKGVLNLGSDIWVLKLFMHKGILFPFQMPTGMLIPLNEFDYGFEQEILIFASEQDALNCIERTQIDMSEAMSIYDLMNI